LKFGAGPFGCDLILSLLFDEIRCWQKKKKTIRNRTIVETIGLRSFLHACGYKVLSFLPAFYYFTLLGLPFGSGTPIQATRSFESMNNQSTTGPCQVKKVQDDPLLFQCCRGSGRFMIPSMASAQDCKPISPPAMPPFETRTFPPPSLTGVPIEYIVGQLHTFAAQYWDKPETADCTISTCLHEPFLHLFIFLICFPVVPFPHVHSIPELPGFSSTSILEPSISFAASYENTALGRRATQPPLNAVPRISLQVSLYLSLVLINCWLIPRYR